MPNQNQLKLSNEEKNNLIMFRDMVDYGSSVLSNSEIKINQLTPKQKYLLMIFTAINNYAEGIYVLCNSFRPEPAIIILRSLVEAYINTGILLSPNSNNRLWLMYIEDAFYSKGLIKEVINFYNNYPNLKPNNQGYKEKHLKTIIDKQQKVISRYSKGFKEDFSSHKKFTQKHPEVKSLLKRAKMADKRLKRGSFEYNYIMVYRYFSEYTHLNLKGMSHFFITTDKGFEGISSQSSNINHIVVTAYFMYLYFLEKLQYYKLLPNLQISKYQNQLKVIFSNFVVK